MGEFCSIKKNTDGLDVSHGPSITLTNGVILVKLDIPLTSVSSGETEITGTNLKVVCTRRDKEYRVFNMFSWNVNNTWWDVSKGNDRYC